MKKNVLFSALLLFSLSQGHTKNVEAYNINDIEKMNVEEVKGLEIEAYASSDDIEPSLNKETLLLESKAIDPSLLVLLCDLNYQHSVFGNFGPRSLGYRKHKKYQNKINRKMDISLYERSKSKNIEEWLATKGWVEASTELAIRSDNEWYRCTDKVDNLNPSFLVVIRQSGSDVTKYVYVAYGSFSRDERNYNKKEAIRVLVQELVSKNKL